ncbi:MAG: DUF61 family protein, partial [Candidatus Thorarchaeota archaeon]
MTPPIDKIVQHEIDSINDHVPATRFSLRELAKSDDPHYMTRSGEKSILKKEEISELASLVPSRFHDEIRLPIVILRRMDYGTGIYTIAGGKPELFLVHHLLGYVDLEWDDFQRWKPIEKLMRPQVQAIRQKLPSTSFVGFVTSVENE